MVKCLETLWQILVKEEDILVVIINAEHNQTSWDPSLLVFRTSRQLDFCLLGSLPGLAGLESQMIGERQ